MQREAAHAFTARVTQASKSELVVITYEMALTEVKEAVEDYGTENFDGFYQQLERAQKFIRELVAALDYKYPLSYDLLSLYLYVNKRIVTAMMKKDVSALGSAESVLQKLLVGFEGVSRQDTSDPVMQNTQQIYAGLTYSRGKLDEVSVNPDGRRRGFIA
jgi:flagellar protein FliS